MTSGGHLYNSRRVAAGYAFARPAVHPRIVERVRDQLQLAAPVARALDIGCGAGRSTAALQALARDVVGIEPAIAMLEHRRAVAPGARFVVGQAERLPFASAIFNLITAAGSINYTDRGQTLAEVARVLAPGGTFVIYDFSAGRRLLHDRALEAWYDEFERRYPDTPGYAMDVRDLPFAAVGLALESYEAFSIPIAMSADDYLRYAMSETRVERALLRGVAEEDLRAWIRARLDQIFASRTREVIFESYAAWARRA